MDGPGFTVGLVHVLSSYFHQSIGLSIRKVMKGVYFVLGGGVCAKSTYVYVSMCTFVCV